MTTLDKEELKRKFKDHVNGFDMKDPNIERKYYHSLRVMDFAEAIGKSINLDDNDLEIAIVGGLLHDYGRFPQWERYNTYSDVDSIDHGNLGVSLLFNENEILNFYSNVKNFDELYDAIKNFIAEQDGYTFICGYVNYGSFSQTGNLYVIPRSVDHGFFGTVVSGLFSNVQNVVNWQAGSVWDKDLGIT